MRVAHVDHHQERRPALVGRQRAGVLLGLAARAQHRVVEALGVRRGLQPLRLADEAGALVAVDEAVALAAVAVAEGDAAFEDVGVVARVLRPGVRLRHAEQHGHSFRNSW